MGAAPAAALPAAASSASPKPALPAHVAGPRATTTTWLRVVLAAVLAAAVPFWPYGRACGAGLFLYLGVTGMVVLAGGWSAVSAWHRRRPRAHLVALLVTLWGVGLVAHEILPRIGYARAVAHWTCG